MVRLGGYFTSAGPSGVVHFCRSCCVSYVWPCGISSLFFCCLSIIRELSFLVQFRQVFQDPGFRGWLQMSWNFECIRSCLSDGRQVVRFVQNPLPQVRYQILWRDAILSRAVPEAWPWPSRGPNFPPLPTPNPASRRRHGHGGGPMVLALTAVAGRGPRRTEAWP